MSRDRDRILEQALKHELRAADTAVTDACLDAETLGAWADDGLDAAAMLAAEAHVSNCTRCQAMVAAFTRAAAPGTVAPVGPVAPAAPAVLAWWKWLAPLAAGAAAVTLWMVVPEQQQVAVAPPPMTTADRAPAQAADAPPSPPSPSPRPATPARERQAARDNSAAQPREDRQQLRDETKQEKANALAETVGARKEDAPPAAPPSPAAAPVVAPPRAAAQEAGATLMRKQFAPLEIISPDPARRWRVAGSAIERSEDAGVSWTPVRANSGETITAGTSPAGTICWLIGTNGLVLVAVDGITFARVPLPDAVDLTSIAATDAQRATVTAADGRRFRTDDSGRTWRAL